MEPSMRYEIEGTDLCIRIPLDVIAAQAVHKSRGEVKVKDKAALAKLLGKELIDCEDAGEEPYLHAPLDAAMERVLEGYDTTALEYPD